MGGARLSKAERQAAILAEIRLSSAIRVSALAERLDVAGETIRRDLAELAETGQIARTYGGAALRPFAIEPAVGERTRLMVEERARIGLVAAQRVAPGQIVMIDGGATTYQVARHLAQIGKDLTVLTNSLPIAVVLCANPTFRVLMAPGQVNANEHAATGEETVEFLQRFTAHLAIIGASALSPEGPCEAAGGVAAVKRAMIARAAATILVADHTKFGKTALERVAPYKALAEIITDQDPGPELSRRWAEAGLRLHLA